MTRSKKIGVIFTYKDIFFLSFIFVAIKKTFSCIKIESRNKTV